MHNSPKIGIYNLASIKLRGMSTPFVLFVSEKCQHCEKLFPIASHLQSVNALRVICIDTLSRRDLPNFVTQVPLLTDRQNASIMSGEHIYRALQNMTRNLAASAQSQSAQSPRIQPPHARAPPMQSPPLQPRDKQLPAPDFQRNFPPQNPSMVPPSRQWPGTRPGSPLGMTPSASDPRQMPASDPRQMSRIPSQRDDSSGFRWGDSDNTTNLASATLTDNDCGARGPTSLDQAFAPLDTSIGFSDQSDGRGSKTGKGAEALVAYERLMEQRQKEAGMHQPRLG